MKSKNKVGKRVAEARAALGPAVSQQELAKRLQAAGADIDLVRLAAIENGTRGARHVELISLAQVLNTSVHYLLTGVQG
jgi:hypothetical protein